MKILLVGEYSNVHATLAEGLKQLGHQAVVLSNGDFWKNYPRDIDLVRTPGKLGGIRYMFRAWSIFPKLQGFDVVQLINPMFLELRAERIFPFYQQLRRQNKRIYLGSFGIDKPWVEEGRKPDTFRYGDFQLYGKPRSNPFTQEMETDWLHGPKGVLFDRIAADCDGIITGLYENYRCCQPRYADKLHFIPFPIDCSETVPRQPHPDYKGLRFFIGIQRERSAYKGTDIMLRALRRLQAKYPDRMQIVEAENVPFPTYQNMMNTSDVLLDQLYSYTPGMNGLLAMAKGLILVGGGEEEHYKLMGEPSLRPIVNVQPDEEDVFRQMERQLIMATPEEIARMSADSVAYVQRHHDHITVALRYLELWTNSF